MTCTTDPKLSFGDLLAAYRAISTETAAYLSTLDRLKVSQCIDLSDVKSCVAVGAGMAEREIEFIQRFMPNLRTFVAVDPDTEFTAGLRAVLEQRLPGVQLIVCNEMIEDWNGAEHQPVDAVLLFDMLYHVSASDRLKMFQKLSKHVPAGSGFVVIMHEVASEGVLALLDIYSDNAKASVDGVQVKKDMIGTGFQPQIEHDFEYFENLDDIEYESRGAVIELYKCYAPEWTTHEEIREVLKRNKPGVTSTIRLTIYKRVA